MAVPDFVTRDGSLTEDGQKLKGFIEAQFAEIGPSNDVAALNGMAGVFKHYYVDVHKLKVATPEQWMRDYGNSFARSAWGILEHVEAEAKQAETVEATSEATSAIAEDLKQLKEDLGKEIASLKSENTKLRNQIKQMREDDADDADPADDPAPEAGDDPDEGEGEA